MYKKVNALFLSLIIMSYFAFYNVSAIENDNGVRIQVTKSDIGEAYQIGTNILSKYYRSFVPVKNGEDNDILEKSFYQNLKPVLAFEHLGEFICQKQQYFRFVRDNTAVIYEDHLSEYKLLDYNILDNSLYLKIKVDVRESYLDGSKSGYGEPVEMLFVKEGGKLKIADWYAGNYFDENIRGISLKIDNADYWADDNNFNEVMLKVKNEFNNANELFARTKTAPLINTFETNNIIASTMSSVTSFTTTNRSNMASYALTNCSKDSPASGGFSVPYKDFSEYSGSYDCTNFVSHVLLKGGAKPYDTGVNGVSSSGWYYRTTGRSSSWSGVNQLHSFLVSNSVKGPRGTSSVYNGIPQFSPATFNLSTMKGNVVQIDYDSNSSTYEHSTVITGSYSESTGVNYVKVTGRTDKNRYNYNVPVTSVSGSIHHVRVINLTGYIN